MPAVTLARNAMATRFELVLHGEDPVALRAAGEEALDEIDRIEARLSLYRAGSEIAQLNARAALEPVRVSPTVFALLQQARQLHIESGGAFDVTIAPLVRCWGFIGGAGKIPLPGEFAEARANVGMRLVHLDDQNSTVRFECDGVMLDLGAIGKGYAVDRAAEILRAAGIGSALVHGGTSTVYAIGMPPDAESWNVAIEGRPASDSSNAFGRVAGTGPPEGGTPNALPVVPLRDEAMSVSAVWGRCFQSGGRTFGHVIDPRSGQPVDRAWLAAVVLPSATETDALSTALLVLGAEGLDAISRLRPGMKTLVLNEAGGKLRAEARGVSLQPESKTGR